MERRYAIREALGLTLVLASTFCFLAFASYHPADSADIAFPANDPVANAGGRVGATLAYNMFFWLGGVASIALVTLLAAWGLTITVVKEARSHLALRATGMVLFLCAVSSADAMMELAPLEGLPAGGALGAVLGPWFLRANFGATGTYLILLYATACSLLLATDFLFYRAAIEMWGRSRGWAQAVRTAIAAKDAAARAARATGNAMGSAANAAGAAATRIVARVNELDADAEIDAEVAAAAAEQGPTPISQRLDARSPSQRRAHRESSRRSRRTATDSQVGSAQPTAMTTTGPFVLPAAHLLEKPEPVDPRRNTTLVKEKGRAIEQSLGSFKVTASVVDVEIGPTITRYELELGSGVKVSAVRGLSNDLAVALKAPKVRIVAPIPGRDTIGVEVPNPYPAKVGFAELLATGDAARRKLALPLFLGKDAAGRPLIEDLAEMPHLLVAGASGSGKSTCLHSILASLCFTRSPEDVRFVLVDPKMVELAAMYRDMPHLLAPPVTDPKKAAEVLDWLTQLMELRYARFALAGVRSLAAYNDLSREEIVELLGDDATDGDLEPMPRVVLIIDEVSDLMLMSGKAVEQSIARLAQKARAVGIHIVLATQRPSADVLTGLIKANLNCRIAFQVTSRVNSMVILDQPGAENLMGRGDMLYQPPRSTGPVRAQGTYVSDGEIKRMVEHLRTQGTPAYEASLIGGETVMVVREGRAVEDELFEEAVELVLDTNRASATLLQRRFSIGYSRAARLVDAMEEAGIIGPHQGGRPRKVLITAEQWADHGAPSAA